MEKMKKEWGRVCKYRKMAATSELQRDRVAAVSEKIPRANTAQAVKTSVGVY